MKQKTKQVQLRPTIAINDLKTKQNNSNKHLLEGHNVRILVKFKGREKQFPENGFKVIKSFIEGCSCKILNEPILKGNVITALIGKK